MGLIREKHVVVNNFEDLFWMVTEKHRPDETVEVTWPPEVQRGIETLGWRVEVRRIEDSYPVHPRVEPPNWLVVSEGLANSLRSIMEEVDIPKPDKKDPEVTEFLALWKTAEGMLDVYAVALAEASMVEHRHDFKTGDDPEDRCYVCGEVRPEPPEPEPEPEETEDEDDDGSDPEGADK